MAPVIIHLSCRTSATTAAADATGAARDRYTQLKTAAGMWSEAGFVRQELKGRNFMPIGSMYGRKLPT